MKDQVLHAVAAQGLGALLAQRPAHGLGDVALAAAIRAHDGRDAGEDLEGGALREGLEAVDDDLLEPHEPSQHAPRQNPRKKPYQWGEAADEARDIGWKRRGPSGQAPFR